MSERDDLVDRAKIAEQVERYEDMAKYMKKVTLLEQDGGSEPLSDEERNLLSVAYKNVVGTRRSAWRILHSMEEKTAEKSDQQRQHKIVRDIRESVENELNTICDEVIDLLTVTLIPKSKDGSIESQIFYLKMKGDYFRYKVEVVSAEGRDKLANDSEDAYNEAYDIARENMATTHPIRLGLALNFSVYYYEIKNDPEKACKLAQTAFDQAIAAMESESDTNTLKDSTLIMQLLRDNLTLWKNEYQDEAQQEDDD